MYSLQQMTFIEWEKRTEGKLDYVKFRTALKFL